jgi:hypothetical protein
MANQARPLWKSEWSLMANQARPLWKSEWSLMANHATTIGGRLAHAAVARSGNDHHGQRAVAMPRPSRFAPQRDVEALARSAAKSLKKFSDFGSSPLYSAHLHFRTGAVTAAEMPPLLFQKKSLSWLVGDDGQSHQPQQVSKAEG